MIEQKTERQGIHRIGDRGILINKDNDSLRAYRKRKTREFKNITIEGEIKNLKEEISEIKNLLKGLVEANGIS